MTEILGAWDYQKYFCVDQKRNHFTYEWQ
jgi:hypothetical protein